jgi:16S rRNA (guanine527-N7)-methyltransferase
MTGAAGLGASISETLADQCERYFRELLAWNTKTNLTAITDEREVAVKHFLDSLACGKALGQLASAKLLDIGSGAGFPGLPIKLLYPTVDVTLLESSQKKTAFLRHLIGTLEVAQAVVVPKRLEEFARQPEYRACFTHIITRAVNMDRLLDVCIPLLKPNGAIILCRTKPLEKEFPLGRLQIRQEIAYTLPLGYGARVLTILESRQGG